MAQQTILVLGLLEFGAAGVLGLPAREAVAVVLWNKLDPAYQPTTMKEATKAHITNFLLLKGLPAIKTLLAMRLH